MAFISVDGTTAHTAAAEDRAGTCYLPPGEREAWLNTLGPQIIEARSHADLVFITPHWGDNYTEAPEPWMRDVGRRLIEAGADAVVGTSAARVLESLGCIVEHAAPDIRGASEIFKVLRAAKFIVERHDEIEAHRDQIKATVIGNASSKR